MIATETNARFELARIMADSAGYDLAPFDYPRQDDWALAYDAMQFVAQLVATLKPTRIVEFGSGKSTRVLARIAGEYGGRVLSFEHNQQYARQIATTLSTGEPATIVTVPLDWNFYGLKVLPGYARHRCNHDCQFDFAVIDGPPGHIGRESVMYDLFPRLAVGAYVVLDDAARDWERRWLECWKRVFRDALTVEMLPNLSHGVALLRKHAEALPDYSFSPREIVASWRHRLRLRGRI